MKELNNHMVLPNAGPNDDGAHCDWEAKRFNKSVSKDPLRLRKWIAPSQGREASYIEMEYVGGVLQEVSQEGRDAMWTEEAQHEQDSF